MSLSNSDKTYWIAELTRILNGKILKELRDAGQLSLVEDAKKLTKTLILDQLGLSGKMAEYNRLNDEANELRAKSDSVRNQASKIYDEMGSILRSYYVRDESNDGRYYHPNANNEGMLDQLIAKQYISTLKELYPVGVTVADYLEAIANLERTIMLASSSAQVKSFIVKFCERFGVELDADWL